MASDTCSRRWNVVTERSPPRWWTSDAATLTRFMQAVARRYRGKRVIVVWDNLNIHHEGKDDRWERFNADRSTPFEFVHTPVHASWVNQVELWFSILQRRVIRHGSFWSSKVASSRRSRPSLATGTSTSASPSGGRSMAALNSPCFVRHDAAPCRNSPLSPTTSKEPTRSSTAAKASSTFAHADAVSSSPSSRAQSATPSTTSACGA
ncbi:MAG: transposase [Sandaracinaceae bacterium]|nr:transposase [Sandaracinaceae bacterium]